MLRLLDDEGVEVAYNDGFPFCGGNVTAALLEFKMECFGYPTPVAEFALSTECVLDTSCSGNLVVELSTKVPAEDCGRLKNPPPPPAQPAKPAPPAGAFCPSGGGACFPAVNYTFGCCPYPPQPGSTADPSESTCALTAEGNGACIYGDSCALGVPCKSSAECAAMPGFIPSCVVYSCCGQPTGPQGLCFPATDACAPPPARAAALEGRTAFRRAAPAVAR